MRRKQNAARFPYRARGADVAFALAHALGCPLYALYVGVATPERRSGLLDAARRDQAAVLSDLENVARHCEVELKIAIRTGIAPASRRSPLSRAR